MLVLEEPSLSQFGISMGFILVEGGPHVKYQSSVHARIVSYYKAQGPIEN